MHFMFYTWAKGAVFCLPLNLNWATGIRQEVFLFIFWSKVKASLNLEKKKGGGEGSPFKFRVVGFYSINFKIRNLEL